MEKIEYDDDDFYCEEEYEDEYHTIDENEEYAQLYNFLWHT